MNNKRFVYNVGIFIVDAWRYYINNFGCRNCKGTRIEDNPPQHVMGSITAGNYRMDFKLYKISLMNKNYFFQQQGPQEVSFLLLCTRPSHHSKLRWHCHLYHLR
jgi:hypothetical protein